MEKFVYNIKGEKTSKVITLNDDIFGIVPNEHALYLDVKQYLANQRTGTHKSKQRNEISGSTRKLHKQKGTGGSRKGSIKNPLFRGGGRIFGPQPRDYSFKLNKKLKVLARRSALSSKVASDSIIIIEDFNFESPKTKQYLNIIKNLNISDKKSLIVLPELNKNIYLSSRNLVGSTVSIASELNTYEILNNKVVVLSESSVKKIEEILS
jgi:large subunit ribosomal protein L4